MTGPLPRCVRAGEVSLRVDRPRPGACKGRGVTRTLSQTRTLRFGRLEIAYDDRMLTPRAWTLAQSDWAAELLPALPAGAIAELCSGAAHIGLHAVLDSTRRLVCVDDSPVACDHAWRNAEAAGIADRVEVRCAPIDSALEAEAVSYTHLTLPTKRIV